MHLPPLHVILHGMLHFGKQLGTSDHVSAGLKDDARQRPDIEEYCEIATLLLPATCPVMYSVWLTKPSHVLACWHPWNWPPAVWAEQKPSAAPCSRRMMFRQCNCCEVVAHATLDENSNSGFPPAWHYRLPGRPMSLVLGNSICKQEHDRPKRLS